MANYKGKVTVDVSSYEKFKAATIKNAYDYDGSHGYQCYDLAQIFWRNACSRNVTNKTADGGVQGGASGIWGDRANNNKNNEFELIIDYTKLKKGDIIITNNGAYGHVMWLDVDYKGQTYLTVFGQNQGNTAGKIPGAECKLINWNLKKYFLGAFRFKKWNVSSSNSSDSKNTSSTSKDNALKVGDKVEIIGTGNSQAGGKGKTAGGKGYKREVLKIYEKESYPYRIGNSKGTTGFYKSNALKKI